MSCSWGYASQVWYRRYPLEMTTVSWRNHHILYFSWWNQLNLVESHSLSPCLLMKMMTSWTWLIIGRSWLVGLSGPLILGFKPLKPPWLHGVIGQATLGWLGGTWTLGSLVAAAETLSFAMDHRVEVLGTSCTLDGKDGKMLFLKLKVKNKRMKTMMEHGGGKNLQNFED